MRGLEAVVAIDQLRDELDTLKVPKRDSSGLHGEIPPRTATSWSSSSSPSPPTA